METFHFFSHPNTFFMFKSYYVVWKRYCVFLMKIQNSLFKSYYVVWKLEKLLIYNLCGISLNRTMQYGNADDIDDMSDEEIGLNRTMQYGNLIIKYIIIITTKV